MSFQLPLRAARLAALGILALPLAALPAQADTPPTAPAPTVAKNEAGKTARQPLSITTIDDGTTFTVGIGTTEPLAALDVSIGEVKIGSTGAACTHALAGAIRYADAKLQLCDGAAWQTVLTKPSP